MAGFVADPLGGLSLLFIALGLFVLACGAASQVTDYATLLAVVMYHG
ncbi:MAG TPA: hypothetical protein VLR44_01600 [Rhodoferax sp.]|nr:hypothetical protein [Rhodoferax sp.]